MADLRTLIEGLGDMVAVLASADPQKRAELYEALGLRLTWHPDDKKVLVEAQPARVLAERVGGGDSLSRHTISPLGSGHRIDPGSNAESQCSSLHRLAAPVAE